MDNFNNDIIKVLVSYINNVNVYLCFLKDQTEGSNGYRLAFIITVQKSFRMSHSILGFLNFKVRFRSRNEFKPIKYIPFWVVSNTLNY